MSAPLDCPECYCGNCSGFADGCNKCGRAFRCERCDDTGKVERPAADTSEE